MYGLRTDIANNIPKQETSSDVNLSDTRLDYKRPKETLAVIKVNISQSGLRGQIQEERVNPLFEWCKNKGIDSESVIDLARVFGQKDPSRNSIHVHLEGSSVRKLCEETIRKINRDFKDSGFKLFALKIIKVQEGDSLLLYLKNGSEFLLGLKSVKDFSKKTPVAQKHRLESELRNTFMNKGIGLELAI